MGFDHGMHALVGANNGVYRAGGNAQGAAYAPVFVDKRDSARTFSAKVRINGLCGLASDRC
jgi:hypothetical protein